MYSQIHPSVKYKIKTYLEDLAPIPLDFHYPSTPEPFPTALTLELPKETNEEDRKEEKKEVKEDKKEQAEILVDYFELTFPDIQGNTFKLIAMLEDQGIIALASVDDRKELVSLYKRASEDLSEHDLHSFTVILDRATTINKVHLRFLGNLLAGEGKQDAFTLIFLDFLNQRQVPYEIIASYTDTTFLLDWHLTTHTLSNEPQKFTRENIRYTKFQSLNNFLTLLEKKILTQKVVQKWLNDLLPKIIPFTCFISTRRRKSMPDIPVLDFFSYAPMGCEGVQALAEILKIKYIPEYVEKDIETFKNKVFEIKNTFKKKINTEGINWFIKLYYEERYTLLHAHKASKKNPFFLVNPREFPLFYILRNKNMHYIRAPLENNFIIHNIHSHLRNAWKLKWEQSEFIFGTNLDNVNVLGTQEFDSKHLKKRILGKAGVLAIYIATNAKIQLEAYEQATIKQLCLKKFKPFTQVKTELIILIDRLLLPKYTSTDKGRLLARCKAGLDNRSLPDTLPEIHQIFTKRMNLCGEYFKCLIIISFQHISSWGGRFKLNFFSNKTEMGQALREELNKNMRDFKGIRKYLLNKELKTSCTYRELRQYALPDIKREALTRYFHEDNLRRNFNWVSDHLAALFNERHEKKLEID